VEFVQQSSPFAMTMRSAPEPTGQIQPYRHQYPEHDFPRLLVRKLHTLGRWLTRPMSHLIATGTLVYRIIMPGRLGQYPTRLQEILFRIACVVYVLVMLPLALPLGILGGVIRLLTSRGRPQVVVVSRHDPLGKASKPVKEFSMSTFNVALLPEFARAHNGLRPSAVRFFEVVKAILQRNDDIVCLQELFQMGMGHRMYNLLKHVYPHAAFNAGYKADMVCSGLAFFSKFPLADVQFWQHSVSLGADAHSNKGVLAATVLIPVAVTSNGREAKRSLQDSKKSPSAAAATASTSSSVVQGRLFLFTTHLNSSGFGFKSKIGGVTNGEQARALQLREMWQRIGKYVGDALKRNPSTPESPCLGVMQAGDYNLGPLSEFGDEEWQNLRWYFRENNECFLREDGKGITGSMYNIQSPTIAVCHDMPRLAEWTTFRRRIDHILLARQFPSAVVDHEQVDLRADDMNGSSDHKAVRGVFQLSL
jgi:exonuclease III